MPKCKKKKAIFLIIAKNFSRDFPEGQVTCIVDITWQMTCVVYHVTYHHVYCRSHVISAARCWGHVTGWMTCIIDCLSLFIWLIVALSARAAARHFLSHTRPVTHLFVLIIPLILHTLFPQFSLLSSQTFYFVMIKKIIFPTSGLHNSQTQL